MDGQNFLSDFLENGKNQGMACDTMKDGFATLVDSEGQPYVANLNPKEKERYEETKKPLSKVKKEKVEEKKTEEKSEEKSKNKISFKDRLRQIISLPFNQKGLRQYDKDFTERTFSKLDPDDEKTEKILNELEDAIKRSDAEKISDMNSSILSYVKNPDFYEKALKTSEQNLAKTRDLFDKFQKKIRDIYEKEKEAALPKFKEMIKKHTGQDVSDHEATKRINQMENNNPGTMYRVTGKEVFKIMKHLHDGKTLTQNMVDSIKEKNAATASGVLSWIRDKKDTLKKYKDEAKEFANANNLAMDSADFAEIQSLLNQIDFSIEDMAQDSALDAYFDNINLF